MKKLFLNINILWFLFILTFPLGIFCGHFMASGQDAAGTGIGVGLGLLFALIVRIAISIAMNHTVINNSKYSKTQKIYYSALPWIIIVLYSSFLLLTSIGNNFLKYIE